MQNGLSLAIFCNRMFKPVYRLDPKHGGCNDDKTDPGDADSDPCTGSDAHAECRKTAAYRRYEFACAKQEKSAVIVLAFSILSEFLFAILITQCYLTNS